MKKLLSVFIFLVVLGSQSWSLNADLRSVEIDLVLRTDGKADLFYTLDWSARGGQMHGFYFEGMEGEPVFNLQRCFADLSSGVRVPLEIKKIDSHKFDVILENGKGFSGSALYKLNYGSDLLGSGNIGDTESQTSGKLFFFDWAPVTWDEPLEHRTVRIVLPIQVASDHIDKSFLESISFLTEKYVNSENKIDYYGTKGDDGRYYCTLRFHQINVPAQVTQRLQFYILRAAIPMKFEESTDIGKKATSRKPLVDTNEDSEENSTIPADQSSEAVQSDSVNVVPTKTIPIAIVGIALISLLK